MFSFSSGESMKRVLDASVDTISYYKISVHINIHNLM